MKIPGLWPKLHVSHLMLALGAIQWAEIYESTADKPASGPESSLFLMDHQHQAGPVPYLRLADSVKCQLGLVSHWVRQNLDTVRICE